MYSKTFFETYPRIKSLFQIICLLILTFTKYILKVLSFYNFPLFNLNTFFAHLAYNITDAMNITSLIEILFKNYVYFTYLPIMICLSSCLNECTSHLVVPKLSNGFLIKYI